MKLFTDGKGIKDLQFGLKHGLYIQSKTRNLYSWGDKTYGQTGNTYTENWNWDLKKKPNFDDEEDSGNKFKLKESPLHNLKRQHDKMFT